MNLDEVKARQERQQRIERRFQILYLLGKDWRYFRLLQETTHLPPGQPVVIDEDLAERFSRPLAAIRSLLREMDQMGIIEVQEDEGGHLLSYRLGRPDEVGRQFIEQLLA